MNDLCMGCQTVASLLLRQVATILTVSQDNFAYALAESLGKQDKIDTVKGYFRKVPQKYLISPHGYKQFRKGVEESIAKLCQEGFICDVDVESAHNSWEQHGKNILRQLDKIHQKAVDARIKAAFENHRQEIENLLSD